MQKGKIDAGAVAYVVSQTEYSCSPPVDVYGHPRPASGLVLNLSDIRPGRPADFDLAPGQFVNIMGDVDAAVINRAVDFYAVAIGVVNPLDAAAVLGYARAVFHIDRPLDRAARRIDDGV